MLDKAELYTLLESLYNRYHKRRFICPDPLQFLYRFENPTDREIVGIIASHLAYGKVGQIIKAIEGLLQRMGYSPRRFLMESDLREIRTALRGFRYRFNDEEEIFYLLKGLRVIIERYGSLNRFFVIHFEDSKDILAVIRRFIREIKGQVSYNLRIIPRAEGRSAFKRINLFLRWMVRKDEVDPGGWKGIPKSALIVPLDVHMHKFSLTYGLTQRRSKDIITAIEITEAFREISPDDPLRYDFSIHRSGIKAQLHKAIKQ